MPALTVKAITKALSSYVRPDEDIIAKLNLVMPRIYAMGMWRDLLFDWTIDTTNSYFSLPEHSEGLLGAMLADSPVEAQFRWHDYRISGYAASGPNPIFGVVDDGWHPVREDLPADSGAYILRLRAVGDLPIPEEGKIRVHYQDTTEDKFVEVSLEDYDTALLSSLAGLKIHNIAFEDIPWDVDIVAVDIPLENAETIMARVRGDGVARYRRFRFENQSATEKRIRLLLKRAWQPVLSQTDYIHLGNLNAIKHGLLGMTAEDNADLDRAQYHWTICRQILEEEMDAARGSIKPKITLNPSGTSFGIPNIL